MVIVGVSLIENKWKKENLVSNIQCSIYMYFRKLNILDQSGSELFGPVSIDGPHKPVTFDNSIGLYLSLS